MNISPIHPAIVHLSIAFVVLSVAADFLARITKRERLGVLGYGAFVAALVGNAISRY